MSLSVSLSIHIFSRLGTIDVENSKIQRLFTLLYLPFLRKVSMDFPESIFSKSYITNLIFSL